MQSDLVQRELVIIQHNDHVFVHSSGYHPDRLNFLEALSEGTLDQRIPSWKGAIVARAVPGVWEWEELDRARNRLQTH